MRSLLVVLALAAIILPGIGHAYWTGRWNASDEPALAASRLGSLSKEVGDWEGIDTQIDPRQIAKAELAGYVSREYVRNGKGERLSVFLACGRAGPVSLHSPEICYAGAGYTRQEKPVKMDVVLPDSAAEFFKCRFAKPDIIEAKEIRIYWSWKAADSWRAPAFPRWTFGGEPVLHKLYVIQPLNGPDKVSDEACLQFITDLVPEIQTSVFARD